MNALDKLLYDPEEKRSLGMVALGIQEPDGTVRRVRNSELLPAYYLIPEAIMERCGQELYTIPRFFSELITNKDAIKTIESDLFVLCITDCYAYMVWPYMCPNVPYMEIFSGYEPSWKIAHASSIWVSELYRLKILPTIRDYYANKYSYIPYPHIVDLEIILSRIVQSAMERFNLQPIFDIAKEYRCFEDFDYRDSHQKTDFYRKWYHTRSKKAEFSYEGFQEQCKMYYSDVDWEIPDPLSSFEDEIGEKVDVDRFLMTLDPKDVRILQMRAEGYTYQEVAKELGYKTHSAVVKRVRKIGEQYQKFTGLNFGF